MTKSAAKELARYGIRVNAVAPVAATPMTRDHPHRRKAAGALPGEHPAGPFRRAGEVASAFTYLAQSCRRRTSPGRCCASTAASTWRAELHGPAICTADEARFRRRAVRVARSGRGAATGLRDFGSTPTADDVAAGPRDGSVSSPTPVGRRCPGRSPHGRGASPAEQAHLRRGDCAPQEPAAAAQLRHH